MRSRFNGTTTAKQHSSSSNNNNNNQNCSSECCPAIARALVVSARGAKVAPLGRIYLLDCTLSCALFARPGRSPFKGRTGDRGAILHFSPARPEEPLGLLEVGSLWLSWQAAACSPARPLARLLVKQSPLGLGGRTLARGADSIWPPHCCEIICQQLVLLRQYHAQTSRTSHSSRAARQKEQKEHKHTPTQTVPAQMWRRSWPLLNYSSPFGGACAARPPGSCNIDFNFFLFCCLAKQPSCCRPSSRAK